MHRSGDKIDSKCFMSAFVIVAKLPRCTAYLSLNLRKAKRGLSKSQNGKSEELEYLLWSIRELLDYFDDESIGMQNF